MHDRAAGREVVGRRSRRGRDDQAVGLDVADELAVDRDVDLDHARQRAARDDDVVEREMFARPLRPRALDAAGEQQPRLDARPARRCSASSAPSSSSRPTSVRNPRRPRLTPSSGTSARRVRDGARGVEQRAVAAERDDDVDAASASPSRDAVGQRAPSSAAARALALRSRARSRAPRATSRPRPAPPARRAACSRAIETGAAS